MSDPTPIPVAPKTNWKAALEEARREQQLAPHPKDHSRWWEVRKALERLVPYLEEQGR